VLPVTVQDDTIRIGRHFAVSFQRTLRIPDDGREYPLPPSLGSFPVCRVEDYADRVPASWREQGGVFIPMYQREALWMSFEGAHWRPNAVKVGIGRVNAISGRPWTEALQSRPQDYVVCPDQPWLDGINAGDGFIKQFVAMPLGMGYTVEGQVTGREESGGIQILALDPKPGRFAERAPQQDGRYMEMLCMSAAPGAEMGLGAGGRMCQEIYPDEHGIDTWDADRHGRVHVHIANSMAFREITGHEPPPTPVSADQYTRAGLPWFDLYDEGRGDVAPADALRNVRSVRELDAAKGFAAQQDDDPIELPGEQIAHLGGAPVNDGTW